MADPTSNTPDAPNDGGPSSKAGGMVDAVQKTIKGHIMHIANVSVFQVVAILSGAAILGYVGHDEFHDSEDAICFVNQTAFNVPGNTASDLTRPGGCFDTLSSLNNYITMVILVVLGAFIFYSFWGRGLRGPIDSATMNFFQVENDGGVKRIQTNLFWLKDKKFDDSYLYHIRRSAEILHFVFALGMYLLWDYALGTDQKAIRLTNELPYIRQLFFLWLIVVPSFVSEITRRIVRKKAEKNTVDHEGEPMFSLTCKAVIYVLMNVFVDPQTESLWEHADDGYSQQTICCITAGLVVLIVLWVWVSYTVRVDGSKDELFAYSDFPAYITLMVAFFWNLNARLSDVHQHPLTVNYDYTIHLTYLIAGFMGVWNTPPLGYFIPYEVDSGGSAFKEQTSHLMVQNPTKQRPSAHASSSKSPALEGFKV